MPKNLMKHLAVVFALMTLLPVLNVHAESSVTVTNQSELKAALADANVSTIVLGSDIETTEKINILRPVTIDGAGHTMKYVGTFGVGGSTDNTVWGGIYVLQAYRTNVVIRDIKLTGGNGALLVNGATVKLEGTIDVSGNGFGGIELGQGSGVDTTAHLVLDSNTKIINTTETNDRPTLWVPTDSTGAILEMNGIQQMLNPEDELSLSEMMSLFTPQENPETSDPIVWYFITGFIGIITLAYTSKKVISVK